MTFEEAMQSLNSMDIAAVAAQMTDWHPVILGKMLLAVAAAKRIRYRRPHPGFTAPAVAVIKASGNTETLGQLVKQNTRAENSQINLAVRRLEK